MSRLSRFEEYRFVGTRDTMRVYDSDDTDEFAQLSRRVTDDRLVERKMVQAFAPDTLGEARNRGFQPIARSRGVRT